MLKYDILLDRAFFVLMGISCVFLSGAVAILVWGVMTKC